MSQFGDRLRKLTPGVVAVVAAASFFVVSQNAVAVPGGDEIAAQYQFKELGIALPPGYPANPTRTVRPVNPAYYHIRSWVSSVGAGIAVNDLTGHGRADGMCIVDTRTDSVIVTYTPTAPAADRFTPFLLNPAPQLPMDGIMAPMGCTPGDFNSDGRMDLLVSYWGRTPVLFLARSGATGVAPAAYLPQELVPAQNIDGKYHGPRWNTNAVSVADYSGDGQPDIFIGNYFPDSDVLDPNGQNNVTMNESLSSAGNGGGDHLLRWHDATAGTTPTARYVLEDDSIPYAASRGWTLAVSGADLTGDGLPEVYVANDFGNGHLLYNTSTRDHIRFSFALGQRTPTTPKSFVLGKGSFKGMGIDFADIDHNGTFDMTVSNISTAWGLEESNFLWINQTTDQDAMRADLSRGVAPFRQRAQEWGMAWSGWGWDIKMADFLNSGNLEVVQSTGFVKGTTNRWSWLQEMAMLNDTLLHNPAMWPNVQPGDDVAGDQELAFFARGADHEQLVNVSDKVGLGVPTPTRGVSMADTTGTGRLDLAVARQWGAPAFYLNAAPKLGNALTLHLLRPVTGSRDALSAVGTPAYDATVELTTADGRKQVSQLDGGGGQGGKRSFDVHFGLGAATAPVSARIAWRDLQGQPHSQVLSLSPGEHTLVLSSTAQEVSGR